MDILKEELYESYMEPMDRRGSISHDMPKLTMVKKNLDRDFKDCDTSETFPDHMQVFLRVKPLEVEEKDNVNENEQNIIEITSDRTVLMHPPKESNRFKNLSKTKGKVQASKFTFSKIFSEQTSQKYLFDKTMLQPVRMLLAGQNSLLFTYGVTSSGKTYTMQGSVKDPGILPRSLDVIFNTIGPKQWLNSSIKPTGFSLLSDLSEDEVEEEHRLKECILKLIDLHNDDDSSCLTSISDDITSVSSYNSKMSTNHSSLASDIENTRVRDDSSIDLDDNDFFFSVFVSYAEIYNEFIYDLLTPMPKTRKTRRPALRLNEDKNKLPYIRNLREVQVNNAEEAYKMLLIGKKNLQFACTKLNQNSSRSHGIFTVKLIRIPKSLKNKSNLANNRNVRVSMLAFCDLAGAERSSKTEAVGVQLKESGNINTSLLTLGRCISQLRINQKDSKKKNVVSFRDSKLTRLFQSFFTGNGNVMMIVNINQSSSLFDETLHALKFSAIAQELVLIQTEKMKPILEIIPSIKAADRTVAWASPETRAAYMDSINFGIEHTDDESDIEQQCSGDSGDFIVGEDTPKVINNSIKDYSLTNDELTQFIDKLESDLLAAKSKQVEYEEERSILCQNYDSLISDIEKRHEKELEELEARIEFKYEQKMDNLVDTVKKVKKRKITSPIEDKNENSNFNFKLQISDLEVENEDLKHKVEHLENSLDEVKTCYANASKEKDVLTTVVTEMEIKYCVKIKELEESLKTEFSSEMLVKNELIEQLSHQLTNSREKVSEKEKSLASLNSDFELVLEKIEKLEEKNQDENNSNKFNDIIEQKDKELVQKDDTINGLRTKYDICLKELEDYQLKYNAAEGTIGDYELKVNKLQNESNEIKRIADLNSNQNDMLGRKIKSLNDLLDCERSQHKSANTDINSVIENQSVDIAKYQTDLVTLANKLKLEEEFSQKLKTDLEDKVNCIIKYKHGLEKLQEIYEKEKIERSKAEKDAENARTSLSITAKDKSKVENELEILREKIQVTSNNETAALVKEVSSLKVSLLEEVAIKERYEEKIVNLENSLRERETDVERIQKLTKRIGEIESDLDSCERTNSVNIAQLKKEKHSLENELIVVNDSLKKCQQNYTETEEKLKNEINQLNNDFESITKDNNEKEKNVIKLQDAIQQLANCNETARNQERIVSEKYELLKAESKLLEEIIAQRDETIVELREIVNIEKECIKCQEKISMNMKFEKEIEKLNIEIDDLKKHHINSNDDMLKEINNYKEELNACVTEKESNLKEIENLKYQFDKLSKNCDDLSETIVTLKREKTKLENVIETFENQLENEKEMIEKKNNLLETSTDEIKKKEELINSLTTSLTLLENQLKDKLIIENKLNEDLKLVEDKLITVQNELETIKNDKNVISLEMNELKNVSSTNAVKLNDMKDSATKTNLELKELQLQIENAEKKIISKEAEINSLENDKISFEEEIVELHATIEKLTDFKIENKQVIEKYEKLKKEVEVYEKTIKNMKEALIDQNVVIEDQDKEISQLKKDFEEQKATAMGLNEEETEHVKKIESLLKENKKLEKEIMDIKNDRDEIIFDFNASQTLVGRLQNELHAIQNKNIQNDNEKKNNDESVNLLKNKFKSLEEKCSKIKEDYEKLSIEHKGCTEKYDKFRSEKEVLVKEIKKMIDEKDKKILSLEEEIENGNIDDFKSDVSQLQSIIQEQKREIEILKNGKDKIIDKLKKDYNSLMNKKYTLSHSGIEHHSIAPENNMDIENENCKTNTKIVVDNNLQCSFMDEPKKIESVKKRKVRKKKDAVQDDMSMIDLSNVDVSAPRRQTRRRKKLNYGESLTPDGRSEIQAPETASKSARRVKKNSNFVVSSPDESIPLTRSRRKNCLRD